jgi:hypothetical protein
MTSPASRCPARCGAAFSEGKSVRQRPAEGVRCGEEARIQPPIPAADPDAASLEPGGDRNERQRQPVLRGGAPAFTKALQAHGYQVLLVQVDDDHSLDGVVPRLASYRVDAIVSALPVLSKAVAKALADVRVPTISFNTPVRNRWVAAVCSDGAGGAAAVAELFLARGARRCGFIAGSEGSHASSERLRGYRDALRKGRVRDVAEARGDFTCEGGYAAVVDLHVEARCRMRCSRQRPDGDRGARCARHGLGLRVPRTLVAGHDVPEVGKAYDSPRPPGRPGDGRRGGHRAPA